MYELTNRLTVQKKIKGRLARGRNGFTNMKEGTERPVQDLLTIDWASLSAIPLDDIISQGTNDRLTDYENDYYRLSIYITPQATKSDCNCKKKQPCRYQEYQKKSCHETHQTEKTHLSRVSTSHLYPHRRCSGGTVSACYRELTVLGSYLVSGNVATVDRTNGFPVI